MSHCNIAQSSLEHQPKGALQGSTLALHLMHERYFNNCATPTICTFSSNSSPLVSTSSITAPISSISTMVAPSRGLLALLSDHKIA